MRYWLIAALVSLVWGTGGVDAQERQLRLRAIELDKDGKVVKEKDGDGRDKERVERKRIIADVPDYWIGVAVGEISETTAAHLNLNHGLVAQMVTEKSPAAKAGLQKHDILLTFGGAPLHTMSDLIKSVEAAGGEEATLEIVRKGDRQKIKITPEKRPEMANQPSWPEADRLFKGHAELERLFNEAMKDPNAPRRFMLVRPPIFEQGAKMPKDFRFKIEQQAGEPGKVEVWVDGKKYEAESIETLPPEVQKYIDLDRLGKLKLDAGEIQKFRTELPKFKNVDKEIADSLQKMREQMQAMQEQLRKLQEDNK